VSISHHLAHAYSAFAVSPFEDGAVMIVDGVGSYRSDAVEPYPSTDAATPLARESESYYKFSGATIECLKKVWMEPDRGFLSDEFYNMPGLGALYSRASTYIFGDWNKCGELMGLAPYGRPEQVKHLLELNDGILHVPHWTTDFKQPYVMDSGSWEASPSMRHWEDLAWRVQDDTENVLLARARWLRETTGAKNLCIAGGVALNCVANGRVCAGVRIRECLDTARSRRRRHSDRLRLLRLSRDSQTAPLVRHGPLLCRQALQRSGHSQRHREISRSHSDIGSSQREYLPRVGEIAR